MKNCYRISIPFSEAFLWTT